MKKILSIILCCLFIISPVLTITSFATENTEKSFVTVSANLSDKMKAYFGHVDVKIVKIENDIFVETHNIRLFNYNDYVERITLPNGDYAIINAGFTNDLNPGPFETIYFSVGKVPNTTISVTINKDMSGYPDVTTAVQTTSATTTTHTETTTIKTEKNPQELQSNVVSEESTDNTSIVVPDNEAISNNETSQESESSSIVTIFPDEPIQTNWVKIVVPIIFFIVIFIVIFIYIIKKRNQ